MTTDQIARRSLFVLLIASALLLAQVIGSLAAALFTAAVFAGVLWPVCTRLTRILRGRRRLAAGVLVFGSVVLLIGPLLGLSAFIVSEASQGIDYVADTIRSEGVSGLSEELPEPLAGVVRRLLEQVPARQDGKIEKGLEQQVRAQGAKAAAVVAAALSATGSFVFQTVMILIALFFLLVNGDELVGWLDRVSPLREGQTRELLREFKKVSYAVIVSTVITSAIQAVAALIGYYIARVPHPVFFGTLTFVVAFIPAVGAASVTLVAALLLLATGHAYAALFLVLWGVFVVGLVDNLAKPLLIRGGLELHGAIVFFALIGGLAAFGAVGLLMGPLSVALFLTLLRIYERDAHPIAALPPATPPS